MVSRALFVAVLAVALVGCGPSLSSLVRDRHYREAVCAVNGGDSTQVMDALVTDAALTVRAHRWTAAELDAAVPHAAQALGPRAAIVVVELDSHRMPIDALSAEVSILDEGEPASMPATRSAVISATGETEPHPELVQTRATAGNVLLGLGYLVSGGLPLIFGSIAAMTTGHSFDPLPDRALVSVAASESEYERLAPIATAIDRVLPRCGPEMGAALRCRGALLVDPRLDHGALRLVVHASSHRAARDGRVLEESCTASRELTLDWPRMSDDLAAPAARR